MANPTKQPPIRSRRRAKLRVVGTKAFGTRHAHIITFHLSGDKANVKYVVEVLTFDEFDKLPDGLRPKEKWFLPALGWLIIRYADNEEEVEDIEDTVRLGHGIYVAERTPAWD